MWHLKHILFYTVLVVYQACQVYSECDVYTGSGFIKHVDNGDVGNCFTISNQDNQVIHLDILRLHLQNKDCSLDNLQIEKYGEPDIITLCKHSPIPFSVRSGTNVKIRFHSVYFDAWSPHSQFFASYNTRSTIDSFEGVSDMRAEAMSLLYDQCRPSTGWKDNKVRALIAHYLSNGTDSNILYPEELMIKEMELEIALAFFKPTVSPEQLSMFINALLLTCHDPHHFYGKNLVKLLKNTVENSNNVSLPIVYLALCNANVSWPIRAENDLVHIFQSDISNNYVRDLQAIALMAASCYNKTHVIKENSTLFNESRRIAHELTRLQLSDGSFGNMQSTALLIQSLTSSKQISTTAWKLEEAVTYLIETMNSTKVDFLTLYWALPVLNGKSLSDISETNCSGKLRQAADDTISEVKHSYGSKIQIQYSLYIGNEADVIHTIFLKVPQTFTAFKIMKLAEEEDSKYRFQWKKLYGKIEIYKIANIMNDPETGTFWMLNLKPKNSSSILALSTKDPEKITLGNEDHLIMWYKNVDL